MRDERSQLESARTFTNPYPARDTAVTDRGHGEGVPRRLPLFLCLLGFAAAIPVPSVAHGGADQDGRVVGSVFFVAKSENRNQVHYGIRLDSECRPAGDTPVFAYWRMFERGPLATEPLLALEQPAYGLSAQRVVRRDDQGGSVFFALNALPKRPIAVESTAVGATCTANARAVVGGVQATLASVFVQLRWPFGVDSIRLSGWASDGHAVGERIAN